MSTERPPARYLAARWHGGRGGEGPAGRQKSGVETGAIRIMRERCSVPLEAGLLGVRQPIDCSKPADLQVNPCDQCVWCHASCDFAAHS